MKIVSKNSHPAQAFSSRQKSAIEKLPVYRRFVCLLSLFFLLYMAWRLPFGAVRHISCQVKF